MADVLLTRSYHLSHDAKQLRKMQPYPPLYAAKHSAVHAARERLARVGIRACYFLQFGYPGRGWAEICETIRLVRRTRPDDIGVSVSYPLPGTAFFNRVQAQLGRKRNWSDSDDLCAIHIARHSDSLLPLEDLIVGTRRP
jgi:radical SAM superfamily enzyme YgiQ (UPF0313 family)